jgi:hypothetical protein
MGGVCLNLQDILKEIVKDTISPLFKERGFKKKGNNFAKILPDLAWTVNIQSYKGNTKDDVQFTINTGIYIDQLFGTYYLTVPPPFPRENYSVLRQRITELKNMPDKWYKLTPTTDIEEIKKLIISDIEDIIFPYFDQMQTIDDVIQEMERNEKQRSYESPHILTILYQTFGYYDKAKKRMYNVYLNSDLESQKEYTKELAERLGIEMKPTMKLNNVVNLLKWKKNK